ncbi:MAG TPA: hypothetical protein VGM65_08865 [Candidatus Udaeobacter sp.]
MKTYEQGNRSRLSSRETDAAFSSPGFLNPYRNAEALKVAQELDILKKDKSPDEFAIKNAQQIIDDSK